MTISLDTVVRRSGDVLFTRLDDELLAVDGERGYLYALNQSAGCVWELIATPTTVADVCARLSGEYAVDADTCRASVIAVLERLNDVGLLVIHAGPVPADH
jgi:hypothetical protein